MKIIPHSIKKRACYGYEGFPRFVPHGKALEIGCGNGAYLARLQQLGWDVTGVDISLAAAASAASLNINVHIGELEEINLPTDYYDFAYMNHSIEHVRNPISLLAHLHDLMRPGSFLWIETPDIESYGAHLFKQYWFPIESPRHLWLFSSRTLKKALNEAGFEIIKSYHKSFPSVKWDATYRYEELTKTLLSKRPSLPVKSIPRSLVTSLLITLSNRLRPQSRDILCVWAQRI